jgi:hypothetical protein
LDDSADFLGVAFDFFDDDPDLRAGVADFFVGSAAITPAVAAPAASAAPPDAAPPAPRGNKFAGATREVSRRSAATESHSRRAPLTATLCSRKLVVNS